MAESQGFEPWVRDYRTHDFQSCAFDHSANSPSVFCCFRFVVSFVSLSDDIYYSAYIPFRQHFFHFFEKNFQHLQSPIFAAKNSIGMRKIAP